MVQYDIKPTRMELIEVRRKITFSEKGHKLLKMKRDGLIIEFFNVLSKARNIRTQMITDFREADEKLSIAKCTEGETAILSAAYAVGNDPKVIMGSKNVMGVVVPTTIESGTVKRRIDKRGYGVVGMSVRIDEATESYEQVVQDIILAAELETTLKKLIDEIERTKRRVNALEFKVIPNLKETESFIRLRLEEMERDNVFRLKRIKKNAK